MTKLTKGILSVLFGCGVYSSFFMSYLIWRAKKYGGRDWSGYVRFNKYNEGMPELIIMSGITISSILFGTYILSTHDLKKKDNK